MIVVRGSVVAHLGGPYGDRLSLSRDGGPFELLVELGWDQTVQSTPQRRVLLTDDAVFVLEPQGGMFLRPPFRARRFDLGGAPAGESEDEVEVECDLCFFTERDGDTVRIHHGGVDPESGRPQRFTRTVRTDLVVRNEGRQWGAPLVRGEVWWYPILSEGLLRVAPEGVTGWPGDPGPVELLGERVVCVDRTGIWIEGDWSRLPGPPLYPPHNRPLTAMAVALPGDRILVLRPTGGPQPVVGGSPARLPAGHYDGLVATEGEIRAVALKNGPHWVPVEF
jgi:hypothetical protein